VEEKRTEDEEKLSESWAEIPTIIPTSSKTKLGKDQVLSFIFDGVKQMGL
jgi:hypothetical protein